VKVLLQATEEFREYRAKISVTGIRQRSKQLAAITK
jgi:hypothetical protein